MRTTVSIAALALIASTTACSKPEPAPEAEATPSADASAATAAAGTRTTPPAAGTYDVTDKDSKAMGSVEIRADGGYTRTPTEGLAESGIVKMVDGKTCFDPSGDAGPTCYTDSLPAADGSFTATMDDGTVLTVKPQSM